ncbi:D-tyrosyl-tRNA(Tyr) deacylase [Desulfobulbus propionicus DSM 2032]|jgi:D-tyrosyl-tRNA(Tyr) deacylase|uniref:D-aminoacyl-tRNA deacylase n=1 Tax=Desulfobulbus propionicus (strain ATCC 33891 / DSM 2032 / VKM B-1956 / 1pr3) TaxID=577650 RepID=A0A7U3YQ36_DESPD|nr:D-tyrosyl-tRNA(Tyr) deacylase [Desulfobulbus propionicus DSM 2032]
MRAVVQRVTQAQVEVEGQVTGAIAAGLLVLLGVHRHDTDKDLAWMVDKIQHLRIFEDEGGLMNRSLADVGGQLLVVSQFTLYGDCRKGRRPSWNEAAPPELARQLYEQFIDRCRGRGIPTQAGVFQAMMQVSLTNSGPVTILLDSHKTF